MPTPGTKEDTSLHSATPFHVRENTAPSRSPVEAPSPVAGGRVTSQDVAENEAVPEPRLHPIEEFSEDPQVQNMKTSCNSCLMQVVGGEALGHLYFGSLKCANCLYVINQCRDFKLNYPPKEKCKKTRSHHVMTEWEQPVWPYLNYCARRDFAISKFCGNGNPSPTMQEIMCNLVSYLKALIPIKNIEPWRKVFEDPQVKSIVNNISSPEAQSELIKNHERDKPAEQAVQQCPQLTSSVGQMAQTSKPVGTKVQQKVTKDTTYQKSTPSSGVAAQPTHTSEPQEAKVQPKIAKYTYQKSSSPSSVALPKQTSQSQEVKVQQDKTKGANQHSAPLACSATQTIRISSRLKEKTLQGRPHQQSVPLSSPAPQTTLKVKLEDTKLQQSTLKDETQDSMPSTSPAAQTTPKVKLEGLKMQPSRTKGAKQDSTSLTSSAAQTTQKSSPQKRKKQEESPGSANQNNTPLTTSASQTTSKSSPQKRKKQEEKSESANQNNTPLTASASQTTQKSNPQKRKKQEGKSESANQNSTLLTTSASQTTSKSSPQKRKMQQESPGSANQNNTSLTSSASQTTQKSNPQKRKKQEEKSESANQKSTPLTTSASQTTQKSNPQKRKMQQKKPNQQSASLTSLAAHKKQKTKPQKTNMQQSRTKDAEQHSASSISSAAHTTKSSKLTKEKLTAQSQAKRRSKLKKKSNMQYSEFIPRNVINSGNFLVVQYPRQECPEECPDCYYPFDPEMCAVNLSTFILDFVCPDCNLSVYVVSKMFYNKPAEQSSANVKVDSTSAKKIKCEV